MSEEKVKSPLLTVSMSPHIFEKESVRKIMWTVCLALLPSFIWSVYQFGIRAVLQVAVACGVAVFTEWAIVKFRKIDATQFDGSAFLTGLLLAFCIPVSLPLWMTALGAAFAVGVAKHTFGGIGANIFNPALVGRAFLLASFPVAMTSWQNPLDATTTATPMGIVKEFGMEELLKTFGSKEELYKSLVYGTHAGSLGETSAILLLLGGIFLIYKNYIRWQTPLTYILTIGLGGYLIGGKDFCSGDPVLFIFGGSVFLGAFFMLTDMVTSPITALGQIVYAFGAGLLVVLIRKYGAYPEGVCYSILLMNALTPLIDIWFKPKQVIKGAV